MVYYEEAEGKVAVDILTDKWLRDNPDLELFVWLLIAKKGVVKEGVKYE